MTSRVSLQNMISFVVYTPDRITSYTVNIVHQARRTSLVILNQEENDLNTGTCKDRYNVNYALLNTALAKAALVNLFETSLSTLLMDTTEEGKDAFVKITALGGAKLYKFTFMVKVAIISVLWEILLKLVTTFI